jgi:hypothetical protein
MEIRTRQHGGRRVPFVGCSSFHRRGKAICPNNLTVPEAHANAAVLSALESGLLNAQVLERALERAVVTVCEPDDDGQGLRQELARVELDIQRYTQAVAAGGDVPILVAALRSADNRRRELSARLCTLQDASEDLNPAAAGGPARSPAGYPAALRDLCN